VCKKYRLHSQFVLFAISAMSSCYLALFAQGRPFTVADSIGMQRFTDPYLDVSRNVILFSPDGSSFLVVTTRGLLDKNLLQSTIWLFDVMAEKTFLADAKGSPAPKPEALAVREGVNNSQEQELQTAILWPRWSTDGQSVLFLGRNGTPNWHLYQLEMKNRKLEQLSNDDQNVALYEERGQSIAFAVEIPWPVTPLPRTVVGTGESLVNLMFPDKHPSYPNQNELWTYSDGQAHPVVDPLTHQVIRLNTRYGNKIFSVDPTGQYAIVASAVASIPDSWTRYEPGYIIGKITIWPPERLKQAFSNDIPERLLFVDLKSGKNSYVFDAPRGIDLSWVGVSRIQWSDDGKQVLLSNVFLPLKGASDAERAEREQRPVVVRFNTLDHTWTRVTGYKHPAFDDPKKWQVKDVRWGASTDEVVVTYTEQGPPAEIYRYENSKWVLTQGASLGQSVSEPSIYPLMVTVRESLTTPPALFASVSDSAQARAIWNPNPQLGEIALAKGEIYNWKDSAGREVKGVLIKPSHFDPKVQYPLVIEPRAYTQDLFVVDGTYPTAVAAQAMAADGLMILQAGEQRFAQTDTFRQGTPSALEGYKAVIAKLAADGLVDPKRVGIIGFSRTCDNVMYAITHDPKLFAAATIANGFTYGPMGYFQIVDETVNNGAMKQWSLHYGGDPFGDGEAAYLKENAIFNLQKVITPLRIETHDPMTMLTDWESYAGLRSLGKPVDLIVLPYATHVVSMPQDVMESQQGDADWFRFWLQGYEDTDPAKADQYKRWENLRELRDADTKTTVSQSRTVPER
jgi:dipeptidyl aminopeptidase/acylaminoacyl peptidase